MGLFKKFQNLFAFQINTGAIDPGIPGLLAGYRSTGLTAPDDRAGLQLATAFFDYSNNRYVNCFRLFDREDELMLIDRVYSADSRRVQGNAIFMFNVPVQHDFEFTDDGSNLFSPDIRRIARHEKLSIYFDSKEVYQRLEPCFQGILDHYERFHDACGPISFFSYPQMNLLGYHVNGRLFGKEELDAVIGVMGKLKHGDIGL
jgi:hypothetical protein